MRTAVARRMAPEVFPPGAGPEIGHGIDSGARFAGPRIDGKKFFGNTFTFLQTSFGSAS